MRSVLAAVVLFGDVDASSKKGICRKGLSNGDLQTLANGGVSWYHNWGLSGPSITGVHFHPTVWGEEQTHSLGSLSRDTVLFGFNEPNMNHAAGGSDMSPQKSAQLWPTVEAAASQIGATTLVGPQLAWVNPAQWYDQFFAACNGCASRMQAVAAHTYNCDLPSLKVFVNIFRKYGKPLWITEMACSGKSAEDQCRYINEAIPYLENEPAVAGYAWFSYGATSLIENGQLTAVGRCYVGQAQPFLDVSAQSSNETIVV